MATERVLAPIASLRAVRDILLHSAGSFDATSAAFGVHQRDISLEARILAVCEAYVHLTHKRPGEPDRSRQAFETLRSAGGRGYDPDVVRTLIQVIEAGGVS
jgi:response regulator RpfG family c-di-GMP phosphodiesterase